MIIQSKRVWVLNNWIDAQIEVEDGKIANIYPYETKPVDKDYGDKRIVPGFIDVHTHGAVGVDVNAATAEDYEKICRFAAGNGTTSWLCSVLTDTDNNHTERRSLDKGCQECCQGCQRRV